MSLCRSKPSAKTKQPGKACRKAHGSQLSQHAPNRALFRFFVNHIKWFPSPTWRNKGPAAWNSELLITVHFLLGQGLIPRSPGSTDNIPHCVFSSPPNPFLSFPLYVQPSLICMLSDSTACGGKAKCTVDKCTKFLSNHRQQNPPNYILKLRKNSPCWSLLMVLTDYSHYIHLFTLLIN